MLGVVFTEFVELVETAFSQDLADDVLDEAKTSTDGAFTAVGNYPFDDMVALVTTLSAKTGVSVPDLLETFGQHLFGKLAEGHGELMDPSMTLFDMLASIHGHIHVEVKRLYPDAELPAFSVLSRTEDSMVLHYESSRRLEHLAKGLILGAAKQYDTAISVEMAEVDPTSVHITLTHAA
ncbi:MAG: heme NO-binding domain-containing protein [Rhodospirillaceae bacterium]